MGCLSTGANFLLSTVRSKKLAVAFAKGCELSNANSQVQSQKSDLVCIINKYIYKWRSKRLSCIKHKGLLANAIVMTCLCSHTHTPWSTLPAVKFWTTTRRSLTHVCRAALRHWWVQPTFHFLLRAPAGTRCPLPSLQQPLWAFDLQQGQCLRNRASSALLACLLGGLLPHPALHEPPFPPILIKHQMHCVSSYQSSNFPHQSQNAAQARQKQR